MRVKRGVALVTVLLLLSVVFSLAVAFFFFGGRSLKGTGMNYESYLATLCADAGLEWGIAQIRRNNILRRTPYKQYLVNDSSFDVRQGYYGVFWISMENYTPATSTRAETIKLKSVGEVYRTQSDAYASRNPLVRRTAYAEVQLRPNSSSQAYQENLLVNRWYEKWR